MWLHICGAERCSCTFGEHTCPTRVTNIVDTTGGFRGRTGVGVSLGCEYVREQKHCSPTTDGSGYST